MGGLAVILSGFPRHSETFALNELRALENRGLLGEVFALKEGDGKPLHPGYESLYQRVEMISELDTQGQIHFITEQLKQKQISAIHAYFAHTPTDVAMKVAKNLNIPYGFSTHAKDARKVSSSDLAQRAKEASCIVACNPDVASELKSFGATVTLMPHGVDLSRFSPSALPVKPLRLLAVGRLVAKKGFDNLIKAVAQLPFSFHLRIVGDGPEQNLLEALIKQYGLEHCTKLVGSLSHAQLPTEYAQAHIVVVPSVVDESGDRDGLPNVVLEAMASGRAVVATKVGAISSAIASGFNGLLVAPNHPSHLAQAISSLENNPQLLENLAKNARAYAELHYDLNQCSQHFCDFIAASYTLKPHPYREEFYA